MPDLSQPPHTPEAAGTASTEADLGDPRFTRGLILDVNAVLVRHGYPERRGVDLVDLMQALFVLLHPNA
jgi:hypothetical protein